MRRVFLLRAVYPRFGARMYPRREIAVPEDASGAEMFVVGERGPWEGAIRLLNTEAFPMRAPVDWDANPIGHTLWQFRLHEWEWAHPLIRAAEREAGAADELGALLEDYWGGVAFGHRTAFEPYPLSRRLVVWCEALRVAARAKAGIAAELAAELDRGARALADNLEHDLDNNHVIANAKALAFAGMVLDQPYARTGLELLWEQLRLQVRRDGTHVENSTLYHFMVWRDGIETCRMARGRGFAVPADIPERLAAMRHFLDAVRQGDGTFPLLNDSVEDEFWGYDELAALEALEKKVPAKRPAETTEARRLFADSGYATLCAGETKLVFDAGALGPAWCPGHGHADTLSFALWAEGGVRIADAGTYQYEAGEWRDHFRGTGAHNTLQVDDADSSEVTGSFRVGRMARAKLWTDGEWVCGEHDGYARLREPVTHTRKIRMDEAQTITIRDEIRGRGEHTYALRFHYTPGAQVNTGTSGATIRYPDGVGMELEVAGAAGTLASGEGWHSPTWYTKFVAPIVELKWRGTPPFELETRIRFFR